MSHRPHRQVKSPGLDSLIRFLPQVTRKAFEKHGFSSHEIAENWAEIVGPEIARYASPERIRWRRKVSSDSRINDGGVLTVRVEGPRAIELQHQTPQIMERINGYFGYLAVVDVRIVQGPLPQRREPRADPPRDRRQADDTSGMEDALGAVTDPGLRAALGRLGRKFGRRHE